MNNSDRIIINALYERFKKIKKSTKKQKLKFLQWRKPMFITVTQFVISQQYGPEHDPARNRMGIPKDVAREEKIRLNVLLIRSYAATKASEKIYGTKRSGLKLDRKTRITIMGGQAVGAYLVKESPKQIDKLIAEATS